MKRADIARLLGWHMTPPPADREPSEGCDYYQRIHDPGPYDYAWVKRGMNDSEFVSMMLWINGTMVGGRMVEQQCPQILLPVLHPDIPAERVDREFVLYGERTTPGRVSWTIRGQA